MKRVEVLLDESELPRQRSGHAFNFKKIFTCSTGKPGSIERIKIPSQPSQQSGMRAFEPSEHESQFSYVTGGSSTQSTRSLRRQFIQTFIEREADFQGLMKSLVGLKMEQLIAHPVLREQCRKIHVKFQNEGNQIPYQTFKQDIISMIDLQSSQLKQNQNTNHSKNQEEEEGKHFEMYFDTQPQNDQSYINNALKQFQEFELIDTQIQLLQRLKEEVSPKFRNKFIEDNRELIQKQLKSFGLGRNFASNLSQLESQANKMNYPVGKTTILCFSIFPLALNLSNEVFFVLDIFTIWDLKSCQKTQCDGFIQVLSKRICQYQMIVSGGLGVTIGTIIGTLVCPGLGSIIGGIIGLSSGLITASILKDKIKLYLASQTDKDKYRYEFYKKALKTLGFNVQPQEIANITDAEIELKLLIEWNLLRDPTVVNDKQKLKNQEKFVKQLVSYLVIQRYRHEDRTSKQLNEILDNYQNNIEKSYGTIQLDQSEICYGGLDETAGQIDI